MCSVPKPRENFELMVSEITYSTNESLNYNHSIPDINECKLGYSVCPRSSMCTNTNGSYYCNCTNGTQMDESENCAGMVYILYILLMNRMFKPRL